jgi:hypothetical protein
MFRIIVVVSIAVAVSIIAWSSSNYYIEDAKQQSVMMKACVETGGQWLANWRPSHSCERPSAIRQPPY